MTGGRNPSGQRGQVLIAGIFILLILLAAILAGVDIFHTIRAKFKVETAQEAAALAGASWQRDSLNLIGEINLIKGCAALLENSSVWATPLPTAANHPETTGPELAAMRAAALQSRIDILTEMQSRVAFLGPVIGFAAAQQAAKANGLAATSTVDSYIQRLESDVRYDKESIYGYRWKQPYIDLLRAISGNRIAVFPNVRSGRAPIVIPSELRSEEFYEAVLRHAREIGKAGNSALKSQSSWNDETLRLVKGDLYRSNFANPPWWEIDSSQITFPEESEVFTLGVTLNIPAVSTTKNYTAETAAEIRTILQKRSADAGLTESVYRDQKALPVGVSMNFFCYDESWYPEYFRAKYSDYESDHFDFWYNGDVLRGKIKKQYRYEGPAAYVESRVTVGQAHNYFRISGHSESDRAQVRIGSRRGSGGSAVDATSYRPGTIAKPLGELDHEEPVIALPLVLPVFDQVTLMPTYLPLPYNFSVLRDGEDLLEKFLDWLARQQSLADHALTTPLPAGCEQYLEALRILEKDEEFRCFGWNYRFNESAFTQEWAGNLAGWFVRRSEKPDATLYNLGPNGSTLPGYLQEPQKFYDAGGSAKKMKNLKVDCTDYINGGTAVRHYLEDGRHYAVVDSRGHIITNADIDPTIKYSTAGGGSGPGFSSYGGSGKPDTRKGSKRL